MKKLSLFTLAALMFALAACTKSDPGTEPVRTTNPEGAAMHFYGVALPEVTRGAAQHDRLWHNGTTVKVKFLNGNTTMQDKVEEYAKEWEKYANITFKFVENEDAHVRVGFDWNANRWVTWSYIGTDCKVERNQAEATMSFADFDYKSEDEIRGDVLRAFGQALGLELESRNINFAPQWSSNVNRVKSYWELDIEDVTWDVIKQYVFDPLDADNAISTDEYDVLSIMRWPFPGNILLNGGPSAGTANTELSELDKVFISELYPKDCLAKMEAPSVYDRVMYLGVGVDRDNAVFIDWGDGTVETAQTATSGYSHYYEYAGEYTITIHGDAEALYRLFPAEKLSSKFTPKSLDISGCTHLRELGVYGYPSTNQLSSLDVSNCPLLERLEFSGTLITTIDISNNPLLKELDCSENQLTSLDVSNNPLLENLNTYRNQLTNLDVSNNPLLVHLNCTQLTSLDISNNPLLKTLGCIDGQLTSLDLSNNPLLEIVGCSRNQLTSLDLSNNPLLMAFGCYSNQLTSLDVSNNPQLWFLDCYMNQLTDLNVSNNPLLEHINCYSNQLTSLDISNSPLLEALTCNDNQLTSLDISNSPLMEYLSCVNNQLTSLDVSNNPRLDRIHCQNNPLAFDQVALVALANSLPDMTGWNNGGYLSVNNWDWISDICAAKNWKLH